MGTSRSWSLLSPDILLVFSLILTLLIRESDVMFCTQRNADNFLFYLSTYEIYSVGALNRGRGPL